MYAVTYENPTKVQAFARKYFFNIEVDTVTTYFNTWERAVAFARYKENAIITNACGVVVTGWC